MLKIGPRDAIPIIPIELANEVKLRNKELYNIFDEMRSNLCKEDLKKCPCDHGQASKRYCGSPTCVRDTKEKGHCLCGLFLKGDKE